MRTVAAKAAVNRCQVCGGMKYPLFCRGPDLGQDKCNRTTVSA